jgi:hypothetical protein
MWGWEENGTRLGSCPTAVADLLPEDWLGGWLFGWLVGWFVGYL